MAKRAFAASERARFTHPALVDGAVGNRDAPRDVRGEMLELKNTINATVDQLNGFISEVTRVAREVGTKGKLGQAVSSHHRGRRSLQRPHRQRQHHG